jgi:hypothetical protein
VTHSARLRLLLAGILFCALLAAGAAAAGVLYAQGILRVPSVARRAVWWFTYDKTPSTHLPTAYAALLAQLGASLFFALRLRHLFARAATPQSYFFLFFLCAMSLEALRVGALLLAGRPALLVAVSSRLVYAGRLFGTLCLFAASLFGLEIRYSRLGTLLGVAGILGLMYAYTVPLDSSVFLANGLFRLGDEKGAAIIFFAMYLFIVANPIVTAVREQSAEPLVQAAVFVLVIAGRELLQFSAGIAAAATGAAAFLAGCILFVARSERESAAV